jgi:hypothetical protein
MRLALVITLVAACDLQPPPPAKQAEPAKVSSAPEVTATCLDAATNFANVFIAGADQTQRATLEQERARLVKRTEEACATKWSDSARACYAAAKDVKALGECGKLVAQALTPPQQQEK